jgi:MFS family permease
VCIAGLLLLTSLYMLFPVAPIEMSDRLGMSEGDTGFMFLAVTAGMLIGGPFHAYIIDAYRRRTVCVLSFIGVLVATAFYGAVTTMAQLLALCVAQGVCAGLGITAGITLAIDITNTGLRSYGNLAYSWMIRLGMLIGVSLGVLLYEWYDFELIQTVSIIIGAVGVMCIMQVYVPFRAPIVTHLCSFDRYFLPRGWVPAINLALIAFIPGLMIPIFHNFTYGVSMGEWEIPFFAFVTLAFPLAIAFHHYVWRDRQVLSVVTGLVMIIVSAFLIDVFPSYVSAVLLGFGLGLVTPEFLMMFVRISEHCQRCTANMTHFLAWETGLTAGIALSCRWNMILPHSELMFYGRISAVAALAFFLLFTVPYFKKYSVE